MIIGLVPTYNEASTIHSIVEILKTSVDEVIVVDDGSQDGTSTEAKRAGAKVVSLDRNFGVGRALRAGFQLCIERECSHVILVDGDGAHDAREAESLISHHIECKNDLTIGNRFVSSPAYVPTNKVLANCFAASLLNLIQHHDVNDVACGMRVLSRRCLSLEFELDGYDMVYEILLKSLREKLKIGQFEASVRYDGSSPLLTPVAEFLCLIDVAHKFCKNSILSGNLLKFREKLVSQKVFKVVMNGYPWMQSFPQPIVVYGQPIKDYDSYLFQCSHPYYEEDNHISVDLFLL